MSSFKASFKAKSKAWRQQALQKTGRREGSQDSPEISQLKTVLEAAVENFDGVLAKAKAFEAQLRRTLKVGQDLCSMFSSLPPPLNATESGMRTVTDTAINELLEQFQNEVLVPLSMYEQSIKRSKALRRKLDTTHLQYDDAVAKVALAYEKRQALDAYEAAQKEFITAVTELRDEYNLTLRKRVALFLTQQQKSHAAAAAALEEGEADWGLPPELSSALFRSSLDDVVSLPENSRPDVPYVPLLVTRLISGIKHLDGHHTEGIFRLSAGASDLKYLRRKLAEGDYAIESDAKLTSPHTCAALLKEWLRGLPVPLVPFDARNAFCRVATEQTLDGFAEALRQTRSATHKATLRELLLFVQCLLSPECLAATKMAPRNLSVCLAPAMLRSASDNQLASMQGMKEEGDAVTFVFQHIDEALSLLEQSSSATASATTPLGTPSPRAPSPLLQRSVSLSTQHRAVPPPPARKKPVPPAPVETIDDILSSLPRPPPRGRRPASGDVTPPSPSRFRPPPPPSRSPLPSHTPQTGRAHSYHVSPQPPRPHRPAPPAPLTRSSTYF
ncbi:MAG: hypothetical protein MHM6MM_001214 [Cercozoa sp. M6MM]